MMSKIQTSLNYHANKLVLLEGNSYQSTHSRIMFITVQQSIPPTFVY